MYELSVAVKLLVMTYLIWETVLAGKQCSRHLCWGLFRKSYLFDV